MLRWDDLARTIDANRFVLSCNGGGVELLCREPRTPPSIVARTINNPRVPPSAIHLLFELFGELLGRILRPPMGGERVSLYGVASNPSRLITICLLASGTTCLSAGEINSLHEYGTICSWASGKTSRMLVEFWRWVWSMASHKTGRNALYGGKFHDKERAKRCSRPS